MDISVSEVAAVVFALLMVSSLIAMPAIASGPDPTPPGEHPAAGPPGNPEGGSTDEPGDGPPGVGGPPGHDRGEAANVAAPDLEENASVDLLLEAGTLLAEVDLESDEARETRNETLDALNASLSEFRSPVHADSAAAFDHLRDTQRGLERLADEHDGDGKRITKANELIVEASDVSARFATVDAYNAVTVRDHEFETPGQRQQAESALGNAADALERAENVAPRGQDQQPAADTETITHYRNAWEHADSALDVLEDNTEPTLSLAHHRAFEENGTVLVPVEATLHDVRPYAYEHADVMSNEGDEFDPITFVTTPVPNTRTTGVTMVDLGPNAENRTVTVTASPAHDPDRQVEETLEIGVEKSDVVWDLPDPDEHQEVEVIDEESGVSVDVAGGGVHESFISVTDRTPETDDAYRAGPMVRITNETSIDEAEVTIPVEDDLERDGNLSVYTWDPHDDESWTSVETEVDPDTGTATATVDSFSFFSVFWIEDWEDETSDTISIDEEFDDGGGEIQQTDFVFVIDTSGSMRGDRIRNARLAAQRFVGAFTGDERGALVEFSSSGNLIHGLTREHEALNESIRSLDTGGGTNTGDGLWEGIHELEDNGWENRSQTIILLADGGTNRGPDPVGVAEEAADRDIEISTVGLGSGIDEAELRAIAGAADGDYYHVQNADDLPDTFERVAQNETGIDLQDTNGDGIPDVVAEMDLVMPAGEPGVVGEPLDLDPIRLDTSRDGILDNETVDINYRVFQEGNETKLHASVTYAEHHPARNDTTGDGLTDAEQLEGWEIEVVGNHTNATELMDVIGDPDDDRDPTKFFDRRDVDSDPLVTDTNGDGLTDVDAFQSDLDPRQSDTTGDGISDYEALLELDDEDPTVFTTTPPEVTLTNYDEGIDNDWFQLPRYAFSYSYIITDNAGVGDYELRRNDVTRDSGSGNGGQRLATGVKFESEAEATLTRLRGADTIVTVEDVHGNGQSESLYYEHDLASNLADYVLSPEEAGKLSGFTHGMAELPDFLYLLWNEHEEILSAMREFLAEVDREFLAEMIKNLPESVHETQDRTNPYEAPGDDVVETTQHCLDPQLAADSDTHDSYHYEYCQFFEGWYGGYAVFLTIEFGLGSKGTIKAASSSDDVAGEIRRASDDIDEVASHVRRGDVSKTSRINQQLATDGGYPNVDTPAVTRHLRDEHGIETAGGIKNALDTLEDLRHLEDLSSSEQAALAARLSKSSDPSAARAFVNELDDVGDVRVLLDQDQTTVNRLVDWHANPGSYRHIDSDLEANDLVHIARNGDVNEVRAIVKGSDEFQDRGSVQWLEEGHSGGGMKKIVREHGDDFRGAGGSGDPADIESYIYDVIRNPDTIEQNPGGGTRYYAQVDGLDKPVRVATGDNGFTINAFPDSGAPV